MAELKLLGRDVPNIFAASRVQGSAKYLADLPSEGVLHVRLLLSKMAHARIKAIDVSEALRVDGVRAILTHADAPKVKYNSGGLPDLPNMIRDQYILTDKVRFWGEPIAAVAARTETAARLACSKIKVELEDLPAVFTTAEAMAEGAPLLHAEASGNLVAKSLLEHGNVEEGFAQADLVLENRYSLPIVQHVPMELPAVQAELTEDGGLRVISCTQTPFHLRRVLSELFSLPLHRVLVQRMTHIGGGFGGKQSFYVEPIAALLAKRTGKKVRLVLDREQTFTASRTRHSCQITLKTGFLKDGTIAARSIKIILNTGAYADQGGIVIGAMFSKFASIYKTPNFKYEALCVYTNLPVAGAQRGYGNPQVNLAIENQMEIAAQKLGLDPVQLRLKNAYHDGEIVPMCGWQIRGKGLACCLEAGQKYLQEHPVILPEGSQWKHGRGVAIMAHGCGMKPKGFELSGAKLQLGEDGFLRLWLGVSDVGQGICTALTQIAAEVLEVPLASVAVMPMDTASSPYDMGAYASRQIYISGEAVRLAAEELKVKILARAAQILGVKKESLFYTNRKVVDPESNKELTLEFLAMSSWYSPNPEPLEVVTYHSPSDNAPTFAAQFTDVSIDRETGVIKVHRIVSVHDVGYAINPQIVEGQIEGGIHMGLGYALSEENIVAGNTGQFLNPDLQNYKVMRCSDMPEIKAICVENIHPTAPFGAKGIGEPPTIITASAVANGVSNALGIPVKELPMTPGRILEALQSCELG